MSEKCCQEAPEGKWYSHPPMRNVLIAGALISLFFALAHFDLMPSFLEVLIYVWAIILSGHHWIREGLEELVKERKIGIEILML